MGLPAWDLGGTHVAPRQIPSDMCVPLVVAGTEWPTPPVSHAQAGCSSTVKAQVECMLYSPRPRGRAMVPHGATPRPDRLRNPNPLKGEPWMIETAARRIRENLKKVIVGKDDVLDLALAAVLCEGHLLIEDVPGIGKTTLARALAISLGCSFQRIQFTPDLLPSDVTGVTWFNQRSQEFEFRPGPVMAQIVLADEINRATPRTQSALLEAMQERQVTADGVSRPLPRPFLVLATQNPIELEGTFPLPEAQVDRFLIRLQVGYPSAEQEAEILERFGGADPMADLKPVSTPEEILTLQSQRAKVRMDASLRAYLVEIVQATRVHAEVELGASPRAALALFQASQAAAAIAGRDFVLPDDIKRMAPHVLTHRLILAPHAHLRGRESVQLIDEMLAEIPVPVES